MLFLELAGKCRIIYIFDGIFIREYSHTFTVFTNFHGLSKKHYYKEYIYTFKCNKSKYE